MLGKLRGFNHIFYITNILLKLDNINFLMFYTRFHREYEGEDSLKQTHDDFHNISLELGNFGFKQKETPFIRDSNSERAEAHYILAEHLPLITVDIQATKWLQSYPMGEISLGIQHLKKDQEFPKLEDIASHYGLEIQVDRIDNTASRR